MVWNILGCAFHWNLWKLLVLPPDLGLKYGFLDRKYPENHFVFFIASIPWHWWRLISIKSQLERLRSFFLQKIRFFYIFPYILVHNRRQNTNNVIRPPSGWGRSNFCVYFLYPTHKYFVGAVCICSPISFMPEHKMTLPLIWHILADETEDTSFYGVSSQNLWLMNSLKCVSTRWKTLIMSS